MTVGSPPSSTETTELVVPRSIPTARAMLVLLWFPDMRSSLVELVETGLSRARALTTGLRVRVESHVLKFSGAGWDVKVRDGRVESSWLNCEVILAVNEPLNCGGRMHS